MSARMMIPNNPWSSTWNSAQPVPAHRQKRLFDDTREAEKALHYLSTKRLGEIVDLLLPVLTHCALVTLSEHNIKILSTSADIIQTIQNKLQYATKPIHLKYHLYEDIVQDVERAEALIAQYNSLELKLTTKNSDDKELASFVAQLMQGKEVCVPNGPRGYLGTRITKMFCDAQKVTLLFNLFSIFIYFSNNIFILGHPSTFDSLEQQQ